MDLVADERPSDSPLVDTIWHNRSEGGGSFISMASNQWQLVVARRKGVVRITVHGPESKSSSATATDDTEYFGILFKLGAFMPHLPAKVLVDTDQDLPEAARRSFWLNSSTWEIPNFDNADTFVNRLVRSGMLVREPIVEAALQGQLLDALSQRTAQRRYLQATGMTLTVTRQIERARLATFLLKQGVSILDTVYDAGYFDQPHLTRSLKHFIGQTPAQILNKARSERLSILYKTVQSPLLYDTNVEQSLLPEIT
ncbi:MAG: helix-turn-helix transcriptional regulator [Anaerolineae bacterium]|nr:helix-turn-helix transcriptional regulator [Anaerolineae bacterium]